MCKYEIGLKNWPYRDKTIFRGEKITSDEELERRVLAPSSGLGPGEGRLASCTSL